MKIQQAMKFFFLPALVAGGVLLTASASSAADSVKAFFGTEAPQRDGSMFPGGKCTACPEDKDGSIFPGGSCVSCPTTCCDEKPKKRVRNYEVAYDDEIYRSVYRDCKNFAPVMLEYVDFRIKKGRGYEPFTTKLGNYRFRIFGCRRYDKEAILNQGRVMQKDMEFIRIFNEIVGSCYPIIKMPSDLCLETSPSPLPEYILTAEITDYFMNLCDEYSWDKGEKADKRTGTSEMTVVWRLMDITKTNVLWKGTSTGYGEVREGEYNAEIALIESAFADAVSNLRNLPGFEKQLAQRVSPEELAAQRQALVDLEILSDPVKCKFEPEIKVAAAAEVGNCPACPACCPCALNADGTPNLNCPCALNPVPDDAANLNCPVVQQVPVVELVPEEPQEVLTLVPDDGLVEENYGLIADGGEILETGGICLLADAEPLTDIDEKSGFVSTGSGEQKDGNIIMVDDSWIDLPSEKRAAVEEGYFESADSLCIIDRDPYEKLTPENLYRVRASIVSITNSKGKKGAGLIVSDQFVLTSADLITKENNRYDLETINGGKLKASAFRINPSKNTALLLLDEKTRYTPLSLNLDLPEVGQSKFIALGLLNIDGSFENGEGYLDDSGTVSGYRYSEEKGAEIIIDTFVQTVTIGGALIDEHGTINGFASSAKQKEDDPDLFVPTETALRSLGLSICGKEFTDKSPWEKAVYKPLTEAIRKNSGPKDPKPMDASERK